MAAMTGLIKLLRNECNSTQLFTIDGTKMKEVRIQEARFIFKQANRGDKLEGVDFDPSTVDFSDIRDDGMYYSGFQFTPIISSRISSKGKNKLSYRCLALQGCHQ